MKKISLLIFLPSLSFPIAAFVIGLRNLAIFAPDFITLILLVIPIALLLFFEVRSQGENSPGLTLLLFFTIGYYLLASIFNKANINTNNVYFEADSWSWLQRMSAEDGWNMGTRAVHPFSQLIFRPVVLFLSLLNGGNHFQANILLLALAGGICVFLMWKIVKQVSGDEDTALLFASLLGLSASHLTFAGVIESYIFSALCLLLFTWLLLKNRSGYFLIITGVVTFGITVTNLIQQTITELILRKNIKQTSALFISIILIGIILNFFSRLIYPSTEYVFLPQNFLAERKFQKEINVNRLELMTENLLIYDIIAPPPYTKVHGETPRFNFLNGTIREYAWFGWPALLLWIIIMGIAFLYFFKTIRSTTTSLYLSISMLLCLIFNFALHARYGAEPFLYSADWTYAIVLFTSINLSSLARQNWFKSILLFFVQLVFINNMWSLYLIARRASEFLSN